MARKSSSDIAAQARAQQKAQEQQKAQQQQQVLIPLTVTELGWRLLGEEPMSVKVTEDGDYWVSKKDGQRFCFYASQVAEYKRVHGLA